MRRTPVFRHSALVVSQKVVWSLNVVIEERMANTASARKRIRQTVTRTARNQARKSRMRTFVKKVETAIASGDKSRRLRRFGRPSRKCNAPRARASFTPTLSAASCRACPHVSRRCRAPDY